MVLMVRSAFKRSQSPRSERAACTSISNPQDRSLDVQRLVSLGAAVEADYDDHTVMADPQGNEFCLYDPVATSA